MTNLENENKKQSNIIKEETGKFLDQQRQQIENTTSTISDTTNKLLIMLMNTNRQTERFLIKVLMHQTNINKKLLKQFNQSLTIL